MAPKSGRRNVARRTRDAFEAMQLAPTSVMLANASIQNATTLQGLPLGAAFDGFPAYLAASSCRYGTIPASAGMTHVAWSVECGSCFEAPPMEALAM